MDIDQSHSGYEEDEDEGVSEFYRNHPSARNEPYVYANEEPERSDDEFNINDYILVNPNNILPDDFTPPSRRPDAPLAAILNPQLDEIDPRRFFADYKPGEILRFSRLFASNIKSTSKADIWWTSKTFHKRPHQAEEDKQSKNEKKKLKLIYGPPPSADELQMDQDIMLMRAGNSKNESVRVGCGDDEEATEEQIPPWRMGPAKMWYDKLNVPNTVSHFDYGFKLKPDAKIKEEKKEEKEDEKEKETFLPVNLIRWEDDVIYDGEQIRQQLLDELKTGKQPACGWIPTQYTRTYEQFMLAMKRGQLENMFQKRSSNQSHSITFQPHPEVQSEPTSTHSIFPLENYDLLNTRWEDDIIWDDQQMESIPQPKVLTLDYDDDPFIFGMPEDRKSDDPAEMAPNKPFDRKEHQFTKKSKMILGQVQQRQKQEEEEQMETSLAQMTDKDPFNLSNDDYYLPKTVNKSGSSGNNMLIQHSIPSQNIHRSFFPTHMTPFKLRHWHRLPLPKRLIRQFANAAGFVSIQTLTKHIRIMEDQREKMKQAEGGGEIFFMRDVSDLSGRDGQLLILEYSEEHPPLLSQPGMASKIKNYYKRRAGKDADPDLDFGDMAFSHNVPFLGQLQPGQALQSVENNLFRAPIYRHQPFGTDFLLIRNRNGWYIRRCPSLFLVGQECPLYEVPSPNSKRATVFVRDFLLAFIYRLFWASDSRPRRLKMEDIKSAFPHYAESSVRKRLKQCSDFKRLGQGPDQNYWVLRPEFRLPSKEEVLSMVTPEMCCAQYSMLAAEQRLKDAGYGEKYFFTPENEDDSDDQVTIEDEIKCAPWNTTRAFLSSMRGKCLLDQSGIADPTGCGQGFSYVRVSQKPQKDETPAVPKRLVTGTNADLRKLPLKEAKEICREYGVREEEINSLSRWEIIDVIRTLSTQAAKAKVDSSGGELSGMARFARGNIRFNFADMQEKYKRHCQHIFDLQNQTLANPEPLSTDEGSSGEDSDNEELATRLETMLQANKGKKSISMSEQARLAYEDEEKERQDLKRMIHGDMMKNNTDKKEATAEEKKNVSKIGEDLATSASKISGITANQKLKIYRTTKNSDGSESTRVEVVTRPQLIEAYTRIRMTKDETFIQVYAQMDEQFKEERRKEKRRLQDQLRRIRRNEMKVKNGIPATQRVVEKKPTPIKPNLLKMRCSACHGTGHMKTNKNCPLYGKETTNTPTKGESGSEIEETPPISGELCAVDGTKVKINKKLFMNQELLRRKALKLTIPRNSLSVVDETKEDSHGSDGGDISPPLLMKGTNIDDDDDDDENSDNDTANSRASRAFSNSGANPAKRRVSMLTIDDDYLQGPVKNVQRIRADPKVTMGSMLTEIVTELKNIPGSEHLLFAVNPKKVTDYYTIVRDPMDLQKIKNKITANVYELRKDFLLDVKKLLDNSRLYNGDHHMITEAARQMFELASMRVVERESQLIRLEKAINPLLDDNDRVGFGYVLSDIVQKCKNIPKSVPFHSKVDSKKYPLYYDRIMRPMDLGKIEQNVREYRYTSVKAFRDDILQIVRNSEDFNGPASTSSFTAKAVEILDLADQLIDEKREQLTELELNINGGEVQSMMGDMDEQEGGGEGAGGGQDDIGDETMADEDFEDEEGDVGILEEDLAMSGDDMDEEDDGDGEYADSLLRSRMHTSGQIHTDLALSESDEDEHIEAIKKSAAQDNLFDSF